MPLNNEINNYIKNIQKQILYKTKESNQFIDDLKANIVDYIEENQVTDISDIKQHFGSEEEIAKSFLETTDIKTLKRKITIKRLIAVFVIVAILILGTATTIIIIDSKKELPSYMVDYSISDESSSSDFTLEA